MTVELALRDVDRTPLAETLRRGSRLISRKVGLVQRIRRAGYQAQDPVLFAVASEPTDLSRYSAVAPPLNSGGSAVEIEAALASTLGESVERYCMYHHDKAEMVLATHREVAADAVAPAVARLHSREQTGGAGRLAYLTEDTRLRWAWSYSLTEERPRLLPAGLVHLLYRPGDDEEDVGRNASTGLAAGATLEEAVLSGLLEIVERDAFTLAWLHRRVGPRIEVDDGELAELMRERFHTGHPRVDLRLFDLTVDVPAPTVMALMRRPSDFGPVISVCAAARVGAKAAVAKALFETAQGFPFLRALMRSDWEPAPDFSDITSFDRHCQLYLRRPELIPEAFDFCLGDGAPEQSVPLSTLPEHGTGRVLGDIERLVESFRELGMEVLVSDLTTPDVREVGLWVVRVAVPGMVPLHGNHNLPYLGVERLHELPRRLGWRGDSGDGLNPYPHPFP